MNYVSSKGGINIDGIPLTCDWADVIEDDESNSKQVFVSGLYEDVDEELLRSEFSQFGTIHELVLSRNHISSKRKDLAFITYSTEDEAKAALEYIINPILGESISVSMAFSQKAMQEKKKVKEVRKQTIISPTDQNTPNTALLSMMSFINMNKNKLDPTTMTQMMTACLQTMINTTNQPQLLGQKRESSNRLDFKKNRNVLPHNNMNNINNQIINPTVTFPNLVNQYPSFLNPGSLNMINNFPPK